MKTYNYKSVLFCFLDFGYFYYLFHTVSGKVSAHKLVRVFAALCVLCLLGGVVIGVWFIGNKLNHLKALVKFVHI